MREYLDWNIGDEVWVNTIELPSKFNRNFLVGENEKYIHRGIVLPGTNNKKFDPKKKRNRYFQYLDCK